MKVNDNKRGLSNYLIKYISAFLSTIIFFKCKKYIEKFYKFIFYFHDKV